MWGTSSPDDKLTDDLRNAIEVTRISGRRWSFLTAEKLAPSDLGLLQQYRHTAAVNQGTLCPQLARADKGRKREERGGFSSRPGAEIERPILL
jgi:hypothetical protein